MTPLRTSDTHASILAWLATGATSSWGSANTRFRIMNASPGQPNEVSLRYEGTGPGGEHVSIDYKVAVISSTQPHSFSTMIASSAPSVR